ncbi:MAG: maleylacetate reductase, partial [Pseudomonadota bacterium]
MKFLFQVMPARAVFGVGEIGRLGDEIERLGASRAMIACTKGATDRLGPLQQALGERLVGVFDGAEPHCPQPVAEAALERFSALGADAVVPFGGGSTLGLGKVITVRTGRPIVAVPTTYSGSEMTPIYGMKIGHEKRTWRDAAALPKTVIYDPALTIDLPAGLTATTGMNCLAHAVEALYPKEANPIAADLAERCIEALSIGLPGSIERPDDLKAREHALYGGFLGGLLVTMVGIALHHRICHVLGGHFGVPHGESNSVILPYVVAYNAAAAPKAIDAIRRALGVEDAAAGIFDLAGRIGAPRTLRELGMPADGLARAAEETVATLAYNPRTVSAPEIAELLQAAHEGRPPSEGM